jgi:putative redox protein
MRSGTGGTTTTGTSTGPTGTADSLAVEATWDGGYRCRVRARDFEIRADEPTSVGGDDTGPQPTELFLASLASCFALAVAWAARKQGAHLEDLAVRAVGRYQGPKFAELRVEVSSSHDRAELETIVQRAKGACYVSNTLRVVDDVDVVVVAGPPG